MGGEKKGGRQMRIILPFTVTLPRKTKADKVFVLNLNIYRNCHHMTLNQAKVLWKGVVFQACAGLGTKDPARLAPQPPYLFTYTVYPASNRKFDLANVLSIVQKFTDDALIEYGVIADDSFKVIPEIRYRFGWIDKENPRIELEIESVGSFSVTDEKTLKECGL
jgi:hypothetical protein